MSVSHIQKIDIAHLSPKERAIIADSESRRFKFLEDGSSKRIGSSSPFSLGARKRGREGEGESDEEEASKAEQPKDGEESR